MVQGMIFSHRLRYFRISKYKPQREIRVHRNARRVAVRVVGYDNTVIVDSPLFQGDIRVYGVENEVVVEEGVRVDVNCSIVVGTPECPCIRSCVRIGRNSFLGEAEFLSTSDESTIELGECCLFSRGIRVWGMDGHTIRRADGSLNHGRGIRIGKRVWVGMNACITKNSVIADDCIVGYGSVVSGRFEEPGCVIAGAPAAVRSRGVTWDLRQPKEVDGSISNCPADWNCDPPPAFWVRGALRVKLAWCRLLAKRKKDAGKRAKYERRAAQLERRLRGGYCSRRA